MAKRASRKSVGHVLFCHSRPGGGADVYLCHKKTCSVLAGGERVRVFSKSKSDGQRPRPWWNHDVCERLSISAARPKNRLDMASRCCSGLLGTNSQLLARRHHYILRRRPG